MTIASDIIQGRMPDFDAYLKEDNSLEDIDEFGFTALIETAIAKQHEIAKALLEKGADPNTPDVTGRTPLHWAVYQADLVMAQLLLAKGANPNAYTNDGLSILVYPILRQQTEFKALLLQKGAKLDFAQDFIQAKLLGHRYALKGDVDILNATGEFIEIDYEGFILEFTVALVRDALQRFVSSFSTRAYREDFRFLYPMVDALDMAEALLQLQHVKHFNAAQRVFLTHAVASPLLILPAASRGHAIGFIKYNDWFAKIDRGEHSKIEGSANIYRITRPAAFTERFLETFLFQRQPRKYFHETIHDILGLTPHAKLPIEPQTVGNCSWANIQALIPAGLYMQSQDMERAMSTYNAWVSWDQDRALDETTQRFYQVSEARKASIAAILGGVLFQACDAASPLDLARAEKILSILTLPKYAYILQSYLRVYCVKYFTRKGNNLLKILDDCGVDPNIGVNPIATGLKKKTRNRKGAGKK